MTGAPRPRRALRPHKFTFLILFLHLDKDDDDDVDWSGGWDERIERIATQLQKARRNDKDLEMTKYPLIQWMLESLDTHLVLVRIREVET